jgi:PAS domain S-box-containing protein
MRCTPSHLFRLILAVIVPLPLGASLAAQTAVDFSLTPSQNACIKLPISANKLTETSVGNPATDIGLFDPSRFAAELNASQKRVAALLDPTFWSKYKWYVIGVISIVTIESLLIAALLIERRRRWQATRRLGESEQRYREVVETQSELICRFLPDTTLTFVNDAYCRFFGKSAQELIGSKFIEFIPEELRANSIKHIQSLLGHTDSDLNEHQVITPSGETAWQQWVNRVISNHDGSLIELQGIGRDITAQMLANKALRESEERFSKAFRANPQPMSLTTLKEGRYLDVNESFLRMSGYTRDEVINDTSINLNIFETPQHRTSLLVEPLLRDGLIRNSEMKFRTKSGELRTLLSSAELLEIAGEKCILVASSDITERKKLEEELRHREREFSTLVENSPDVIGRLDPHLRYTYVSPTLQKVVGRSPEELRGRTPTELGKGDPEFNAYQVFEACCREALESKEAVHRSIEYRGRSYWTRVIPELSEDGTVESLMTINEDVTDRIRSEKELGQLTVRLFTLQDEERRRIARELHDVTAQNLFAMSMNLSKLDNLEANTGEIHDLIAECQAMGAQSLQEIRTLSYLLHPPLLDQAGLVSALRWYVEGFSKRSGIYVEIFTQPIGRVPADVEMALFRVVQEALTNVRRHSNSEIAKIRLEMRLDDLVLEISDQGCGLERPKPHDDADGMVAMGVGISGMRQRLQQLGGRLDITSNDKGTTVSAVVPMGNGVKYGAYSARR